VAVVAVGLWTLRPADQVLPAGHERTVAADFPSDVDARVRPVATGPVAGPQEPLPYGSFFIDPPATTDSVKTR
jgi:hypothetical protein